MPRIFDNIERALLPALEETPQDSYRADFCVGYFNRRGWTCIDAFGNRWDPAEGSFRQLLIRLRKQPKEELDPIINHNYDIKHRMGREGGGGE